MDPVANIKRQRELAAEIDRLREHGDDRTEVNEDIRTLAIELAGLVQALAAWRRIGGFDPYRQEFAIVITATNGDWTYEDVEAMREELLDHDVYADGSLTFTVEYPNAWESEN